MGTHELSGSKDLSPRLGGARRSKVGPKDNPLARVQQCEAPAGWLYTSAKSDVG